MPAPPPVLALGLGSNLGPSELLLRSAIRKLAERLEGLRVGPLYRTTPLSPVEQDEFLNTVVLSHLPDGHPKKLLAFTQRLEQEAARTREIHWGPRTLDIDLLLWGDLVLETPDLTIPHPRMSHRRFVLAPLADLAPGVSIPKEGRTVAEALADLGVGQRVELVDWTEPPLPS